MQVVVTAAQLLGQAQAEAFASAQPLPAPTPVAGPGRAGRAQLPEGGAGGPGGPGGAGARVGRGVAAWEVYLTHRAAWPQLASAARYALECASAGQRARSHHGLVLEALDRVERAIASDILVRGVVVPVEAVPDQQLLRGARFLAAAGDAMRAERPVSRAGMGDEVGSSAEAQVAATVAAFARLTTVYAEQAVVPHPSWGGRGGRPVEHRVWRDLVNRLDQRTAGTDPSTRGNALTERPLPATDELSLAGAISRWRVAVEVLSTSSDEVGGISGADLDGVAHGMAMLHAAASVAVGTVGGDPGGRDTDGAHAGAAQSWMAAADGWAGAVRVPGRSSAELAAATASLSAALGDYVGDVRAGRAGRASRAAVEDSAALTHFLSTDAPQVAATYRARVDQVVSGEQAFVPARRLVEAARAVPVLNRPSGGGLVHDRGRVSVEVAAAARRGRWVPLPTASPTAAALVTASRTAQRATRAAANTAAAPVAAPVDALVTQQAAGYDRAGNLPDGVDTDGVDPEAAEARRSSAAGFSRPTSETLIVGPSRQNPGGAPFPPGPTRRPETSPRSTPDPDKGPSPTR